MVRLRMSRRATLRAAAFLLNGAVFLVGIARMQGRLAPPDYMYVGLLFAAPLSSWLALIFLYRRRTDPEVRATANAAALILNVLLLVFVVWLAIRLDSETLAEQGLWLVMVLAAPPATALAIAPWKPSSVGSAPP